MWALGTGEYAVIFGAITYSAVAVAIAIILALNNHRRP